MTVDLPEFVRAFLREPNPAVMATVAKDGRPIAAATWYLLEDDGRVLVNFDVSRARLTHLRRDPRFALDVIDVADWYSHVALQLEVVEFTDDTELVDIDALSVHYGGSPYANRESGRVSARAEIKDWLGWQRFAPAA
jgi:PPOX class probable F420-dependent enzyme